MPKPGFMRRGIVIIIAGCAIVGLAGAINAGSPGKDNRKGASPVNTNPSSPEIAAQAALPVITMSVPQTANTPTAGTNLGNEFSAQQLLSGNERGVVHPDQKIMRSQSELEALLQHIYSGHVPPQAPQIDFSQQVLVYYTLGTGMHGSDNVYIRSGSLERGMLHVYVEIAHSGGNCLSTKSLTAPFVIAALPFPAASVHRVEYDISHKSYPCD